MKLGCDPTGWWFFRFWKLAVHSQQSASWSCRWECPKLCWDRACDGWSYLAHCYLATLGTGRTKLIFSDSAESSIAAPHLEDFAILRLVTFRRGRLMSSSLKSRTGQLVAYWRCLCCQLMFKSFLFLFVLFLIHYLQTNLITETLQHTLSTNFRSFDCSKVHQQKHRGSQRLVFWSRSVL